MNDKSPKLQLILDLLEDSLTKKEFDKLADELISLATDIGDRSKKEIEQMRADLEAMANRIRVNMETDTESARSSIEEEMNRLRFAHEALIAEAQAKLDSVRDGQDGKQADEEAVVQRVLSLIPTPEKTEEETPESVRDMLETLEDDNRLDKSAVKGIEDIEKKIVGLAEIASTPRGGGGVNVHVNGQFIGHVQQIEFTGSGITTSLVSGKTVLVVTGGSGVTAVETPTGTVNGVNDEFTVTNEPLYIIVDGVSKFATLHYTFAAGTITITDGSPPVQYIRSVYSA